jgi:hypothetical protein
MTKSLTFPHSKYRYIAVLLVLGVINACKDPVDIATSDNFSTTPSANVLSPNDALIEASGLADSKTQPGHLWSHEDAGSPPDLFLINYKGEIVSKIRVHRDNRDWEDIAVGTGPVAGESYLYIGDIGDNASDYAPKAIIRILEPKTPDAQVNTYDLIPFTLADGTFDCETMLFDPSTKDIYLITKWLPKARIYRLSYPHSTTAAMKAENMGEMVVGSDLTGGSISADGTEIIVRGYANLYYWKRKPTESVAEVLTRKYDKVLPYIFEPQGEAVAFKRDGTGYFTLSEKRNTPFVNLYFYKRE